MRGSIDGMVFQQGSACRRPAALIGRPVSREIIEPERRASRLRYTLKQSNKLLKAVSPGKVLLSITSIVQRTDQALCGAVMLTLCVWREALIRPSTEISCYFFSKEDTSPEVGLQEGAKGSLSFGA